MCPRQYQFLREHDFTPSRSAVIFFGLLVHQTIEEIHGVALQGQVNALDESGIRGLFDRCFQVLSLSVVRSMGNTAMEPSVQQVMDCLHQNQYEMRRMIQTDADISQDADCPICCTGSPSSRRPAPASGSSVTKPVP
jgi:DNA helicase-2/ATP-dependent DNA helicase PcrA